MNLEAVEKIARAVLYEGYMLYPYRPSSVKNQQRFNFGVLYPRAHSEAQQGSDAWQMRTECLVRQVEPESVLEVRVRCLRLISRATERPTEEQESRGEASAFYPADKVEVAGRIFYPGQEATEEEICAPALNIVALEQQRLTVPFHFFSQRQEAVLEEWGLWAGRVVRTSPAIQGGMEISASKVGKGIYRLSVNVSNFSSSDGGSQKTREQALMQSLISTHTILCVSSAEFVSLLDPPPELAELAASCVNLGTYPVLVGEEGRRDTFLSSPIILYDYPQIAPESAGDLFDGTEIDEILSLRIMTMTDEEKREMRLSDDRTRQILERTESLPAEQFMKLHGALRGLRTVKEDAR